MRLKHIQKLLEDPKNFSAPSPDRQSHCYEGNGWYVDNLIRLTEDLPIFEKPVSEIRAIALESEFPGLETRTYADVAYHARVAMDASLEYPIILSEDGRIMDGHHRILKAIILGNEMIKVVQFTMDPEPDFKK